MSRRSQTRARSGQAYIINRIMFKVPQQVHDTLDTLPPACTLLFESINIRDAPAYRLRLGYRTQSDGTIATCWAYIMKSNSRQVPLILVQDELHDDRKRLYPRSAASLLRRAGQLHQPFCHLQYCPQDQPNNVRNMLCALVLHYCLMAEVCDYAIHWNHFEVSLGDALARIEDCNRYLRQAREVQGTTPSENKPDQAEEVTPSLSDASTSRLNSQTFTGGTVSSTIDETRPDTLLTKLKQDMGDNFKLLQHVPQASVQFQAHTKDQTSFPFCLKFGTYRAADVHAYLLPDQDGISAICYNDIGIEMKRWTFFDLEDIDLLAPFDTIRHIDSPSTVAHGVRYLAYYMFLLAENANIIPSPNIKITKTMAEALVVICGKFRKSLDSPPPKQPDPEATEDPEPSELPLTSPMTESSTDAPETNHISDSLVVVLKTKRKASTNIDERLGLRVADNAPTITLLQDTSEIITVEHEMRPTSMDTYSNTRSYHTAPDDETTPNQDQGGTTGVEAHHTSPSLEPEVQKHNQEAHLELELGLSIEIAEQSMFPRHEAAEKLVEAPIAGGFNGNVNDNDANDKVLVNDIVAINVDVPEIDDSSNAEGRCPRSDFQSSSLTPVVDLSKSPSRRSLTIDRESSTVRVTNPRKRPSPPQVVIYLDSDGEEIIASTNPKREVAATPDVDRNAELEMYMPERISYVDKSSQIRDLPFRSESNLITEEQDLYKQTVDEDFFETIDNGAWHQANRAAKKRRLRWSQRTAP